MLPQTPSIGGTDAVPAPPLRIEKLSRGPGFPEFSLTVPAAQCSTLMGPSGSGKSTLLRLIADLAPGTGTARIGDAVREAMPAPAWRRRVIYVAADAGWWTTPIAAHMSNPDTARQMMQELDLPEALLTADPDDTSSGERQRLALIRAIILQPDFLLLDEPTSALDQAVTRKVEAQLMRLKQNGTGLLVVSHDSEQVARISDHRYELTHSGINKVSS